MKNQPLQNDDPTPKRSYDFGVNSFFIAFLSYGWASTIVQEWGQKPSQHFGAMCGIFLCFLSALMSIDYVLWRLQFTSAARNGLMVAAVLGPLATLIAWEKFSHPVWSQVAGFLSTILPFAAFHAFHNWWYGKR